MTGDTGPSDDSADGNADNSPPADGDAEPADSSPVDTGGDAPADEPWESAGSDPQADDSAGQDVDAERVASLVAEIESLRSEVDSLETQVEEKTVHRDDIEAELRRYVRARQRRGHATGWGPYLVLLYGVVMTVGAFFYLGGPAAIVAMIVVWLSTLGLYVVSVVASTGISVGRRVLGLRDLIGKFR